MRNFSSHLSPEGESGGVYHGTELKNSDFFVSRTEATYFLTSEIMFELISELSRMSYIFCWVQ